MNAFNPIAAMDRLKEAGIKDRHAKAIADEMQGAIVELVTKEQLDAAVDRVTVRVGMMLAATATLICTVLAVVISLQN